MRLSDKVLATVLSFILGIAVSFLGEVDSLTTYIFFLAVVVTAVFLKIFFNKIILKDLIIFVIICSLSFVIGIWRFNVSEPNSESIASFRESNVIVTGTIDDLPEHKINKQNIILNNIKINDKKYKDKILIVTELYPEYKFNNYLEIKCNLKIPSKFDTFDYQAYLANKKIYKVCYYPDIKILGTDLNINQNSFKLWFKIKSFFVNLKLKQFNLIKNNLSPPHSALLSAILLGEKSEINNDTLELFSKAGISHIIAISGMHIGIIGLLIFWFFIFLGVGRQNSFKFIAIFLIFYLLLIGFRSSAVRAVVMGMILMYGYKEGRLSSSGRALVFTAGFLLLLNPRLLCFDVGFQLSFLATFGVIYFYPVFDKWLKIIPDKLRSLLAVTLSAQLLTLPLVFYYFGVISFISIISNILILPILPVIIILGLLFISIGFIWSKFAIILGILSWVALEIIIKIVEILVNSGFYV
ncbi:MAG: ComEC/Rec2 family competence protein [Patescibacteria group bacterium]